MIESGNIKLIGPRRHPGVAQVTLLAPSERLQQCGLLEIARAQYGSETGVRIAARHEAEIGPV